MKQKPKIFWKAYTVLCAVLVILIVSVTAFLYLYMSEFEYTQYERIVKNHIMILKPPCPFSSLPNMSAELASGFEKEGAIDDFWDTVFYENEVNYAERRDGELVKYDLFIGDRFMTLTLGDSEGRYGLTRHYVEAEELDPEWVRDNTKTVTAVIPKASELYINGKAVGGEYVTAEGIPDENVSEFERGEGFETSLLMYEIPNIFGEATVEVKLDGVTFSPDAADGGVYKVNASSFDSVYLVTAPLGAEVKLNGVTVSENYKKDETLASDANEFETDGAGRCARYEITGLRFEPKVEIVYDGEILPCSITENGAEASYPEAAKSSYTVKIPHGEELFCNGVSVPVSYVKISGNEKYPVPEAVSKLTKPSIKYDIYEIGGFYSEPTFTVSNENAVREKNGSEFTFYPVPDKAGYDAVFSTVTEFTKLYIKYTYEGTDYTKANLAAVMEFVKPNTDAYDIIEVSYESMRFNSNFKVDKLEMEIYDIIEYADGCYGVKVDFDSHGKYARFEKTAVGTFYCTWIREGDVLRLCEFIFI